MDNASNANIDAKRDGEILGAALEAGDAVEVDGGPSAEEGREPAGVLGLDAADAAERAVGPDGVDVQGVRDDQAGPVGDRKLVVEREGFDGELVAGDADELGRDREVAEAVPDRERDGIEGLARDVLGWEAARGEDVVGPPGGLVGEGAAGEGGASEDGESEGA